MAGEIVFLNIQRVVGTHMSDLVVLEEKSGGCSRVFKNEASNEELKWS